MWGKDGAKTGTGGLWALGLVSNYKSISNKHIPSGPVCFSRLAVVSTLFLCLGGCGAFFFLPTSHLAYLRQWFQMCDVQRAWEQLAKRANKSEAKVPKLQGEEGGALRTLLTCERFKRILWCLHYGDGWC